MKIYKTIFIAIATATVFSSCSQDLLDIEQKGVVSEEEYYSTDEDALSASTVIYSTWLSLNGDVFFLNEALSDEVYTGGGARGDSPYLDDLNEFNFVSNNQYIIRAYSGLYSLIYYSNVLLDKFNTGQSAAIDRCIGEAKMARGWAHMQLASLWGNPPLIDHVLNGSGEYQQPNSNPKELWQFVINDLADAASLLPTRVGNDDKIRMTKEAALAFKGKAEVLSGDMVAAKATLKQVIESGAFSLVPTVDMENLFTNKTNYCSENVFESNIIYSKDTMWEHFSYTSGLCAMLCWRGDRLEGIPSYLFNNGFGYCNPREQYIADIQEHEGKSSRYTAWFKSWDDLKAMGVKRVVSPIYGNCGYFQYKFHFGNDEIPADGFGLVSIFNWRWMRYAEVLLLYAEACAVAGDNDGSGLKALNDVQSRAGAPVTSLTLDNVKTEKKFELFMEGTRYVDLVRWGDAKNVLKGQGAYVPLFRGADDNGNYLVDKTTYTNMNYGFVEGKHELLPYPEAEMISNQNIEQNPNW